MNNNPKKTIDPKLILAAKAAEDLQALINAAKLHALYDGDVPDRLTEMIDEHISDITNKLLYLTVELPF